MTSGDQMLWSHMHGVELAVALPAFASMPAASQTHETRQR